MLPYTTPPYTGLFDPYFRAYQASRYFVAYNGEPRRGQGIKLHVSAHLLNAVDVAQAVIPVLRVFRPSFKVVKDGFWLRKLNSDVWEGDQSGKFITVYPEADVLPELAQALHEATARLRSPQVLSDKQVGDSHVVYYRYGTLLRDPDAPEPPDERSLTTPIPPDVADPWAHTPRRFVPLEHTRPDWTLVARDPYGAVLQSADKTQIYREAMRWRCMEVNRKDAISRFQDELLNPLAHAHPAVLKPTLHTQGQDAWVLAYQAPGPVISLWDFVRLRPSVDLKLTVFENIRRLLDGLTRDGIFWPLLSPTSVWLDEALNVWVTHTDVFCNTDLPEVDPLAQCYFASKYFEDRTQIGDLLAYAPSWLPRLYAMLFQHELAQLPWLARQQVDTLTAKATNRALSVPDAAAMWGAIRQQLDPLLDPSAAISPEPPPEDGPHFTLHLVTGYEELPQERPFYVLVISALVNQAEQIQDSVLDTVLHLRLTHRAILGRPNTLALVAAFANTQFSHHDYGAFITLFFDTAADMSRALDALTVVLERYKKPILPHFPSAGRAPVVHFGQATVVATDGDGLRLRRVLPQDPLLDNLEATHCYSTEGQIPDRLEVVSLLATRARGSVYHVRLKDTPHTPYILKEARYGYETTLTREDAATRCKAEARILRQLAHLPFVPRYEDLWRTSFAYFLLREYVVGGPIDEVFPALSRDQQAHVWGQVTSHLQALHDAGWVWRDLAAPNIVVAPDLAVKFIDLESATLAHLADHRILWAREEYRPAIPGRLHHPRRHEGPGPLRPERVEGQAVGTGVSRGSLRVTRRTAAGGRYRRPWGDRQGWRGCSGRGGVEGLAG